MPQTPPYQAIWNSLRGGRVVPFLGAGASLVGRDPSAAWRYPGATWLPTGNDLRGYLAGLAGLDLPPESSVDLATVAQYYTYAVGHLDLCASLHDIFVGPYQFGEVHKFLAHVPSPLLVMTTNYDDFVERAFKDSGKSYDLIIHQTNDGPNAGSVAYWAHGETEPVFVPPKEVEIDLAHTSVIYKMHGSVTPSSSPLESFVITEDDYIDFLVRMASQTPIPAMITEAIRARHLLFLGYGLADWNFRVMLASLKEHLRQQTAWAIRWNPPAIEEAIWTSRSVIMFNQTIEEFVAQLGRVVP